jgi:hypothetical protein
VWGVAKAFNWPAGSFIVLSPFVALYGLFTTPLLLSTVVINFITAFIALLCMTSGGCIVPLSLPHSPSLNYSFELFIQKLFIQKLFIQKLFIQKLFI